MAKYKKYPEYKDSTDDWLSSLPSEWSEVPLKFLSHVDNSGSFGDEENEINAVLPVATTAQIDSEGRFNVAAMPRRSFTNFEVSRYCCVEHDILVVKSSGSSQNVISGKSGIVTKDTPKFVFSNFLLRIQAYSKQILPKLLYYIINSELTRERVLRMVSGTTYPNLQVGEYIGAIIPLPPLVEQKQIAKFLDHETGKIDRLIQKQQQLIELLKEKRQAVISHAVTKGLNPNAPLKPSNIEWLGDVPEHWEVPQVGYCAFVTKLTGFEYTNLWKTKEDGEVIALRGFNVKERKLELNDVERISSELSDTLVRSKLDKGDIVFPCTGTIGNAALIEEDGLFHINQNIAKIRFNQTVSSRFAIYWLTSSFIRTLIDRNNTSGMQPVVLIGDIRKLPIPRFEYQEQESIADHLDTVVNRFCKLISNAVSAINLMQERRTALISAAVTGKIDVRDWSPAGDESEEEKG